MSKQQHTPGPWKLSEDPETFKNKIFGADNYNVLGPNRLSSEVEANARLIAAAPDLLEALEELISYRAVEQLREYGNYPVFAKVDAAIAKARGEG